jgi:LmbE family N-acetylglucosaminyl deacetylase
MLSANLDKVKRVLLLGAHSDDVEIGCGGTVLRMTREMPGLHCLWVVFSGEGGRAEEARSSAQEFLRDAGEREILVKDFRSSFFPFQGQEIKEFFEELKGKFQPDLVFTHYRDDRHQDHRVLSDLAWNTFRDHLILEYEIPKFDGDLGQPNMFVTLGEDICRHKAEAICRFFKSQSSRHWFTPDTFLSLARLRGIESASPTRYAEAFYGRKIVLGTRSSSG